MARVRWMIFLAFTLACVLPTQPVAAAPDDAVDSPEYTEIADYVAGLRCPELAGFELLSTEPFEVNSYVDDGVRIQQNTDRFWCRYRTDAVESGSRNSVSVRIGVAYHSHTAPTECRAEPEQNRDDPNNQTVRVGRVPGINAITLEYTVSQDVIDVYPGIENRLVDTLMPLAQQFVPVTAICQYEPPPVVCPDVAGFEQHEPETPTLLPLLRARCYYSSVEDDTGDLDPAYVEVAVAWATDRSAEVAQRRVCEDFGVSPRPKLAIIDGEGRTVQGEWVYYGSLEHPGFDPGGFEVATRAFMATMAVPTTECQAEWRTSPWTPIPAYLEDVFALERIMAPPIEGSGFQRGGPADLRVAVESDPDQTSVPVTAPAPESTSPDPVVTDPSNQSTPPPSVTAPASGGSAQDSGSDPEGSGSWVKTALTIVGLVISLCSLALAFALIRKETRVRPAMDVARIVIVLVVAVAMMVLFSRGAPLWAVIAAIVSGAALGWLQGHNLRVRVVGNKLMAAKSAVAVVMFAAGLVLTQVAGLLNRTGVIAIGIALSFLSAATAMGLLVGRRPAVVEARRSVSASVVVLLVGGVVAASLSGVERADAELLPVTAEPVEQPPAEPEPDILCGSNPDERCEAHEYLIDLVAWESTNLNGGLLADQGKPPVGVAVPPAFDSPPDPVTRQVDWSFSTSDDGSNMATYSADETISFGVDEDGRCCSVNYEGSAIKVDSSGRQTDYAMTGQLDDIQPAGRDHSRGSFQVGIPFGEMEPITYESTDTCQRTLAGAIGHEHQAAISTYTENGVAEEPDRDWTEVQFSTECQIEQFSMEDALLRADPLADRSQRESDCPARSELLPALAEGSELEYASLSTVGLTYTRPYEAACLVGGELGTPLPGEMRSQFSVEYAAPEDQDLADETTFSLLTRPSHIHEDYECELDDEGRVVANPGDDPCLEASLHRLDEQGSWVSIVSDNNYDDGPNVEVTASMPWGSYRYRCHYCEPWSTEITRWLGSLHDFSLGWIDSIPDEGAEAGSSEPDRDVSENEADGEGDTTSDTDDATAADSSAPSEGVGEAEGDTEETDDTDAAAMVALLGLLGSAGILATAITESGHSAAEITSTIREGGFPGLNELLDLPEGAVVDEHGEVLVADEDGLYAWETPSGTIRVTGDELQELITEEQTAITSRQDELHEIVTEMYSDEAAQQRFDDLAVNSTAASAEIMAEIRAGWAEVDRLETVLNQRDAALIRLEAAWANQEYAEALGSWDQVTLAALGGMADDVAGLPGEVVDLTRTAVTAIGDPENWQIFAEATAETLYDLAGLAAGNSFGDGAESIADGVKFGGQMTQALATALVTDPVGTVAMLTAYNDFANAVDPDSTLGQRLGSLGMGLVDIAGTLAGMGFVGSADDLIDIARTAEAAQDAVDAGLDLTRVADAAGDATDVTRVADAAGDAGFGISRVPDSALDPGLLQTRDEIADAIRSAQAHATDIGRPVEQVLADTPEVRALFQGSGMNGMAALESAGGMSDEMANAVVRMHDEITENAVRIGTNNTIDTFADATGVRPSQVLVGNSGSVGPGRSVLTDADRTVVLVFEDSQLDAWRAANPIEQGSDIRLPSRLEAQEALQNQFAEIHGVQVELALNNPRDPAVILAQQQNISLQEAVTQLQNAGMDDPAAAAVRLTADQMDTSTYSGLGSLSGQADSYPAGFTGSRQSVQGTADVYRIDPATGEVSRYGTSGQAILDQNEINRLNLGGSTSADLWHDPTRIPQSEMAPLLQQQVQAVEHYDDVKSITKAVGRTQYIAGRTGQGLPDQRLVDAALAIRSNPRSATTVLSGLGMTEREFIDASRSMVLTYGGAS